MHPLFFRFDGAAWVHRDLHHRDALAAGVHILVLRGNQEGQGGSGGGRRQVRERPLIEPPAYVRPLVFRRADGWLVGLVRGVLRQARLLLLLEAFRLLLWHEGRREGGMVCARTESAR